MKVRVHIQRASFPRDSRFCVHFWYSAPLTGKYDGLDTKDWPADTFGMETLSRWSEIANVLYIPLLVVTYIGWAFRFFQKWWSVMKWPDILLVCFGLIAFTLMAVPKVAPYFEQNVPASVGRSISMPSSSTELISLRDENAKLKADNARLRKTKPARFETQNADLLNALKGAQDADQAYRNKVDSMLHDIETGSAITDVTGAQTQVCSVVYQFVPLNEAMKQPNLTLEDSKALNVQRDKLGMDLLRAEAQFMEKLNVLFAKLDSVRPATSALRDQQMRQAMENQAVRNFTQQQPPQ